MATEKENTKGKTFDGGITETDIAKWKNVYGRVMRVDVEDDGNLYIGYFRRPSLQTMSAVNKITKEDEIKGAKTLYDNCFLGGSKEIAEDSVLFMEAQKQLSTLFTSCRSSLKNL